MQAADNDLLRAITQGLVAKFQPERIWLFGSHASGTPTDHSNVDRKVSHQVDAGRGFRAHPARADRFFQVRDKAMLLVLDSPPLVILRLSAERGGD